MTLAVDHSSPARRGQSLAQFQFFYDLGIGVGSLTLRRRYLIWSTKVFESCIRHRRVALLGLWINWKRK